MRNKQEGKKQSHAELVSASSMHAVSKQQQQALKILNQVQDDRMINNGGFTLIELLVVVLIIGILAAVAVPYYQKVLDKANFTQVLVAARAIKNAQEVYYAENGDYTTNATDLVLDVTHFSMSFSFKKEKPGRPNSVDIYPTKPKNVYILIGFAHQSADTWAGKGACFANSKRANQYCAHVTGQAIKRDCESNCMYWLKEQF